MGIFDRVSRLFKSNANAALDKMANPAKELDLLIVEMAEQINKARGEVVRSRGAEKLAAARSEKLAREVETWRGREATVASSGDAALVADVTRRRAELEAELAGARREQQEQAAFASAQQAMLPRLQSRLEMIKAKKGTIHAKLGQSEQQAATIAALDEFARMGDRIESDEATQGAVAEVEESLQGSAARDDHVAQKIAALDSGEGGEGARRLAALKEKMKAPPKE